MTCLCASTPNIVEGKTERSRNIIQYQLVTWFYYISGAHGLLDRSHIQTIQKANPPNVCSLNHSPPPFFSPKEIKTEDKPIN